MRTFCILSVLLGLTGIIALQLGCETKSAESNGLRIEPHAIGLRINQTAEFRATGGFSYTWTLSDASLGILTRRDGPVVTYINRFNPAPGSAAVVQHLTVTSTVGTQRTEVDSSTGATNTVTVDSGFTDTAEAIIEHLPTPGASATVTTTSTTATTATSTTTTTTTTTSGTTTTTTSAFPPLP